MKIRLIGSEKYESPRKDCRRTTEQSNVLKMPYQPISQNADTTSMVTEIV